MLQASLSNDLRDKVQRAEALLKRVESDYAPAALANSFGAEDMVLTDLIVRLAPGIGIFTLDTGRLNEETHALNERVRSHYKRQIDTYFPDATAVESFVKEQGINGFYQSTDARKLCCRIRKVEPLKRALSDKKAWITGLRRAQSPTRANLGDQEYDADNGLEKFNPLIEWSESEVWEYIKVFGVPYNALHDKHYPSIGCAPCTRAIAAGEDIRAGRWWWENPETKECGLHAPKVNLG